MKTLGLDLSLTGTAWRAGPDEAGRWDTPAEKVEGIRRLHLLRARLIEVVQLVQPDMALIEGYSYASPQGAHQAGEWGGAARLVLEDALVPWATVTPQNRAKFATGTAQAKKAAVVSAVASRTGLTFATDDDADAYCLWCMTQQAYGIEHPMGQLPKVHLDAMVTVNWPVVIGSPAPVYEYAPKKKLKKKP